MSKYLFRFCLFFAVIAALYSGVWLYAADRAEREIIKLSDDKKITFLGDAPSISGFPGRPVLKITDGITIDNITIRAPEITFRAIPLPGQTLLIEAANTIHFHDNATDQNIEFDRLNAAIEIPRDIPHEIFGDFNHAALKQWQEKIGSMTIESLNIIKDNTRLSSQGVIGLDQNLQPEMSLQNAVEGYDSFITTLTQNGYIEPLPAALALSALNGMTQTNPKTGRKYALVNTKIQDRVLFIGPIRAVKIPMINWSK